MRFRGPLVDTVSHRVAPLPSVPSRSITDTAAPPITDSAANQTRSSRIPAPRDTSTSVPSLVSHSRVPLNIIRKSYG